MTSEMDERERRVVECFASEHAAVAAPPASHDAGEAVGLSMKEHFEAWQNERVGRRALVKAQQAATIDPLELFAAGFIRGKAAVEVGHE